MDKQFSTIVLVVTIGVLLGVGIVVKQNNDSLMKQVLEKQNTLLERTGTNGSSAGGSQVADLEKRVMTLEVQLKSLQDALKQGLAAANNQDQQPPARQMPPPEDTTKVYDLEISKSPILGNPDAPITIVEFVDFQCPFCARFHAPVLEVLKLYPDKVNYVLKNFPLSFHPQAAPASRAALAAKEQGKYFEMVNAILADNSNLNDETFKALAKTIGLDEKKFWKDYTDKASEYDAIIQRDLELGGRADVRGTPSYYINGKKTFARDVNSYKKEIDQILSEIK